MGRFKKKKTLSDGSHNEDDTTTGAYDFAKGFTTWLKAGGNNGYTLWL